jgi:hypothetical protein
VRLTLHKGQVSYRRADGATTGPFDLLRGNPRKL